jgi:predicted mannosyl-3-phosphoglycerate phosphatase (HAD superfamily)
MDIRPKTIFCDIDGTLLEHFPPGKSFYSYKPKVLSGTVEKLLEWDKKGYNIILTTGRKESMRKITVKQLEAAGIFYDQLIMGIGGGVRVLINDYKPNSTEETAIAITLERDLGISKIDI